MASATGQPFAWYTWAWAVPLDGGQPERLAFGPVSALSEAPDGGSFSALIRPARSQQLEALSGRDRRQGVDRDRWQRAAIERFAADLDGQIEDPQWWDGRVVFLSDHEGWGNVYSLAPDGTELRRHSDHGDAYARNADGDGSRLVYGCFGDLWILDSLAVDSEPRRLELRLGSARHGRVRYPLQAAKAVSRVAPDRTGRGKRFGHPRSRRVVHAP